MATASALDRVETENRESNAGESTMRKLAIKSIILLSVFLLSSVLGLAQETQREKNRHTNPTVTGGTGLDRKSVV